MVFFLNFIYKSICILLLFNASSSAMLLTFKFGDDISSLCFWLFFNCLFFLVVIKFNLFCHSEYTKFVLEALELEDTVKNNERRDVTGWFALKPLIFGFI